MSALTVVGLVVTLGSAPDGARATTTPPALGAVALGAYVEGMDADPTRLDQVEALVGRPMGVASVFRAADEVFPAAADVALTAGGRRSLLVSWHLDSDRFTGWSGGAHDALLDRTAAAVAAYGKPVYIRPWAEMNADWVDFQPSTLVAKASGGTPTEFVAAWRHVVDRFRAAGAMNARWVFNPTTDVYAETTTVNQIWPGRSYVDVLGLDGYNWGTAGSLTWRSFVDIYTTQYQRVTALAPDLPVWLCEIGSADPQSTASSLTVTAPVGQDKGRWWAEALASTSFPAVTTLVFFHANKERDWRVDSSTTALQGLRSGLAAATSTPTPTSTATPTTTSPTSTSSPTATRKPKPPKRLLATLRPQVRGVAKVGRSLRAVPGRWTPSPTRYVYIWRSGGRTLQVSTRPTYRVPARLAGKRLMVWVRATRAGYSTGAAPSGPTRLVTR